MIVALVLALSLLTGVQPYVVRPWPSYDATTTEAPPNNTRVWWSTSPTTTPTTPTTSTSTTQTPSVTTEEIPVPQPPVLDDDNSIVYHTRGTNIDDDPVAMILGTDDPTDGSISAFRIIMEMMMRRARSDFRTKGSMLTNTIDEDDDQSVSSLETNSLEDDPLTTTKSPSISSWTFPWFNQTTNVPPTTRPPRPSPKCRLCDCWQRCRKRRFYWGVCLCGKCHCYY